MFPLKGFKRRKENVVLTITHTMPPYKHDKDKKNLPFQCKRKTSHGTAFLESTQQKQRFQQSYLIQSEFIKGNKNVRDKRPSSFVRQLRILIHCTLFCFQYNTHDMGIKAFAYRTYTLATPPSPLSKHIFPPRRLVCHLNDIPYIRLRRRKVKSNTSCSRTSKVELAGKWGLSNF